MVTPRGRHLGRHLVLAAVVHLAAAAAITGASGCGADERAASEPTSTAAAGTPSTGAHTTGDDRQEVEPVTSWRYVATTDDELSALEVRACFVGRPEALAPNDPDSGSFLVTDGDGLEGVELRDQRLVVRETDAEGCIRYTVDLSRAAAADDPIAARATNGLLVGAPLWAWGPVPRTDDATGTIRFAGPAPVHVPWDRVDGKHRLGAIAFVFDAAAVFGQAAAEPFVVRANGVEMHVVRMADADALQPSVFDPWLSTATGAVTTLFDAFPVPRATIVLLPVDADRPVACGHTYRGGGASIVLRVAENATAEQLRDDDWVTVHEMIHLGLPYIRHSDAWLSEGLATYYQEVLRARSGMQSEQRAWARILDGFERAREETTDVPLREVVAEMHATHAFERVYWSGAAIAMLADVEMRRRQVGSLDEGVRALHECCAWPPRENTAEAMVERVDAAVGAPVLSEVAGRWLQSDEFPEVEDALEWLGVRRRGDDVRLIDRAPGAEVRRAIMAAPADRGGGS